MLDALEKAFHIFAVVVIAPFAIPIFILILPIAILIKIWEIYQDGRLKRKYEKENSKVV